MSLRKVLSSETPLELPTKEIVLAELENPIRIRSFTGKEGDEFSSDVQARLKRNDYRAFRASVVALGVVDEEGNLEFDKRKKEDLDLINTLPNSVIEKLSDEILAFNGISVKGREDQEKN